jgi:hypothetical protein
MKPDFGGFVVRQIVALALVFMRSYLPPPRSMRQFAAPQLGSGRPDLHTTVPYILNDGQQAQLADMKPEMRVVVDTAVEQFSLAAEYFFRPPGLT